MSVEKEIRKILSEAVPAATRAKQELVRSGLGHDKNATAIMKALENPEAAMKNPAQRERLIKVMQDLLDVVVNDPSMVSKTKSALRKEEVEEIEEKLVGGQKKIDANKNGKLDAEDFKKLRMKKEEEEKAEQMIEAKKSKKDEEDDEEKEDEKDEKESEKAEKEEDDEDEKTMTNPRKSFKGFVKSMKEDVQLEQAPAAPAPVKHRIAVTVSEPDHPMVTKRKEQVLKHVVVSHGPDKKSAQKLGEKFYKKQGYKVHGSEHAGLKEETMGEVYNPVTVKKGTKRTVDSSGKVKYSGGVRVKGKGASSAGKVHGHAIDVEKRKERMQRQKHPLLTKIKDAGKKIGKAIDKVASIKVANKNRAGG